MPDIEQILRSRIKVLLLEIRTVLLNDALRIEVETNKWLQEGPRSPFRTRCQSNVLKETSHRSQDRKLQSQLASAQAKGCGFVSIQKQIELQASQTVELLRSKNHLPRINKNK